MSGLNCTRVAIAALAVVVSGGLAGCATINDARGGPGQRLDPWEKTNRKIFNFNEDVDRIVLKPVATVYTDIVPRPIRRGVSNFFGNFSDAWSAVNNMLQGKFQLGFDDATRVGANTLFGLFGVLDVAAEMGSNATTRISARRWGTTASAPVRTSCCRSWARRRSGTPRPCRSIGWYRRRCSSTALPTRSA